MENDFEKFYQTIDQSEIEETWKKIQESRKKRNLVSAILCVIIDVPILVALISFFIKIEMEVGFTIFITLFVEILVAIFIILIMQATASVKNRINYSELYKSKVIKKIMDNFFPNAKYMPNSGMPKVMYDCGEYKEYYNVYESDDYIDAFIRNGKNPIKMAEVKTIDREQYTDSDGNTYNMDNIMFHGLFAQININKNIECNLRIRAHDWGKQKDEIKMDSEEFEKIYDVETTNEIVAMQFLTHDVMEELVKYRKILNSPLDIYISGSTLNIRLHVGQLFEYNIKNKEVIDKSRVERYFLIIRFIEELSNRLVEISEGNKY